jgi:hypothetical protein
LVTVHTHQQYKHSRLIANLIALWPRSAQLGPPFAINVADIDRRPADSRTVQL